MKFALHFLNNLDFFSNSEGFPYERVATYPHWTHQSFRVNFGFKFYNMLTPGTCESNIQMCNKSIRDVGIEIQ